MNEFTKIKELSYNILDTKIERNKERRDETHKNDD